MLLGECLTLDTLYSWAEYLRSKLPWKGIMAFIEQQQKWAGRKPGARKPENFHGAPPLREDRSWLKSGKAV